MFNQKPDVISGFFFAKKYLTSMSIRLVKSFQNKIGVNIESLLQNYITTKLPKNYKFV